MPGARRTFHAAGQGVQAQPVPGKHVPCSAARRTEQGIGQVTIASPTGRGSHLPVRPAIDAVLSADLLQRSQADAQVLGNGFLGHLEVLGQLRQRELDGTVSWHGGHTRRRRSARASRPATVACGCAWFARRPPMQTLARALVRFHAVGPGKSFPPAARTDDPPRVSKETQEEVDGVVSRARAVEGGWTLHKKGLIFVTVTRIVGCHHLFDTCPVQKQVWTGCFYLRTGFVTCLSIHHADIGMMYGRVFGSLLQR